MNKIKIKNLKLKINQKMKLVLILFIIIKNVHNQSLVKISAKINDEIIGLGPENMGIGMGHSSLKGNWAHFLDRLGVNSARLFVTSTKDLRSFIGNLTWGKNLNNEHVHDYTSFSNSIKDLRT